MRWPTATRRFNYDVTNFKNAFVILEVVVSVLLMAGILFQTPKATGLGGTIGGGDGGLGGGYRTRRGLERQIYYTTWVLTVAFLAVSLVNIWIATRST
jgi:protein translocase SecG subunit